MNHLLFQETISFIGGTTALKNFETILPNPRPKKREVSYQESLV